MKFTFICEDLADVEYSGGMKMTQEFQSENIHEILVNFKDFLTGCSFQIQDYYLTLEKDDEPKSSSPLSADEILNGPKSLNDVTDNAN